MGQYYRIINLTKREYLDPHYFGDGLKLMEFALSGFGTMAALGILLASGNGRGGGDLRSESRIVGSWAGDKIVIGGDYDDPGKWCEPADQTLYETARKRFRDISDDVIGVMVQDGLLGRELKERTGWIAKSLKKGADPADPGGPTIGPNLARLHGISVISQDDTSTWTL